MAATIVGQATDPEDHGDDPYDNGKNRAAGQLGDLGGRKGRKARAAKLTPKQRSTTAKKAAAARWSP